MLNGGRNLSIQKKKKKNGLFLKHVRFEILIFIKVLLGWFRVVSSHMRAIKYLINESFAWLVRVIQLNN